MKTKMTQTAATTTTGRPVVGRRAGRPAVSVQGIHFR